MDGCASRCSVTLLRTFERITFRMLENQHYATTFATDTVSASCCSWYRRRRSVKPVTEFCLEIKSAICYAVLTVCINMNLHASIKLRNRASRSIKFIRVSESSIDEVVFRGRNEDAWILLTQFAALRPIVHINSLSLNIQRSYSRRNLLYEISLKLSVRPDTQVCPRQKSLRTESDATFSSESLRQPSYIHY